VKNYIKTYGTILFDPEPLTSKHERQSDWKRTAVVEIEGDIHHYYRWLLAKRYNMRLIPPHRGAHVTFINDKMSEMNGKWDAVKEAWDGKRVEIYLNIDFVDSDGLNWWLPVPYEYRLELQSIRSELGLGKYKWGFHMTIGTAVDTYSKTRVTPDMSKTTINALNMNQEHSKYIYNLIKAERNEDKH
jgi:hypothetical protein